MMHQKQNNNHRQHINSNYYDYCCCYCCYTYDYFNSMWYSDVVLLFQYQMVVLQKKHTKKQNNKTRRKKKTTQPQKTKYLRRFITFVVYSFERTISTVIISTILFATNAACCIMSWWINWCHSSFCFHANCSYNHITSFPLFYLLNSIWW